jgi:hypothetical protein
MNCLSLRRALRDQGKWEEGHGCAGDGCGKTSGGLNLQKTPLMQS